MKQKFNNPIQPNPMKKLLQYKIVRFFLFILIWIALSQLISLFNKPAFRQPSDYFNICATTTTKDDKLLPLVILKEYEQAPNDYQLCKNPIQSTNSVWRLKLHQNPDQTYLLKTWNDSLADPVEYHYKLIDDKVEPIAWRHGGMIYQMMSYFWGLLITLIIHSISKRVWAKRALQAHTQQ